MRPWFRPSLMGPVSLAAVTLLAAACGDFSAPPSTPVEEANFALGSSGQPVPDQYVVVFRREVSDVPGLARQLVSQHRGTLRFTYTYALKGFSARLSAAAAGAVRRNPHVAYVEQDQEVHAFDTQTGATWGLDRIDQRDLPLSTTYTYVNNGSGVTVYIIDTGIRLSHNEFDGAATDRASFGFDAINDGQNGNDCHGHGTHVAGTVGGTTWGVAKAVALVAVRVLNCSGSGSYDQVIAGVDWVTANHAGKAVANMSLGGGFYAPLNTAVTNSIAGGVTYAIAAGNSSADACGFSPAATPNALTVGATTSTDARAYFSNYGTCLDLFAPGYSVTSAWNTSDGATNTISGTSMAAPHVAGAAALYLSGAAAGTTPAQVATALTSNATLNKVTDPGTGSDNLLLYTGSEAGSPPSTNLPPTASFTSSCSHRTCIFTSTASDPENVPLASRSWNFGDGASDVGVQVQHTYSKQGLYTITHTVADDIGQTASAQRTLRVKR